MQTAARRCLSLFAFFSLAPLLGAEIHFERVPDAGIQPQVHKDLAGKIHFLYFKGEATGGDLFYTSRPNGNKAFSPATPVNSQPGSVLVAGTMRGPQMAVSHDRVHVVWMGGNGAAKVQVAGQNVTPLLYTRLNPGQNKFERERNILRNAAGLDGGQTVAADMSGNVYVIWHGAPPSTEGEEDRGLYVARSKDDGATFATETRAMVPRKGACACCGVRAKVDDNGALHVLFRAAEAGVNRSELWLKSADFGQTFAVVNEDPWKTATCPASSASFDLSGKSKVAAWETDNHVAGAILGAKGIVPLRMPEKPKQKHPTLATNARGEIILTWVEDAGWGGKGTLVCQLFDANGQPVGAPVRKSGLPAWSFGAPFVNGAGEFVVIY